MINIFSPESRFFIGDVVYEKSGSFGPRRQVHLQLVYFFNGTSHVFSESGTFEVAGGQSCFLIPGETYRIAFSHRERVRHGWVDAHDSGGLVPESLLHSLGDTGVFPFSERMQILHSMARDLLPLDSPGKTTLQRTLGQALFEEALLQAGAFQRYSETLPPAVWRARSMLEQHFAQPLSLDQLARETGVSKTHLLRLFKTHLQTTPGTMLWKLRVAEGLRLLRETGLRIGEVSDRCGFRNPYHFSRVIRRTTRLSPRKYRLQQWERPHPGDPT